MRLLFIDQERIGRFSDVLVEQSENRENTVSLCSPDPVRRIWSMFFHFSFIRLEAKISMF